MSSYTTINVDTSMCLHCNGQIPTTHYLQHIQNCYQSQHAHYEQEHDVMKQPNNDKILNAKSNSYLMPMIYYFQHHINPFVFHQIH